MEESYIRSRTTKRLLVMGISRTGTSLLQRLLNVHPKVFVTYESIYRPFLGDNNWDDLHAYYYEVLKQHKHLCLALHDSLPPDSLKPFSFEEYYEYFGDKGIYNASRQFRRRLKRTVSSEDVDRIIFILRDPRARMLSYLKWVKRRNLTYKHTAQSWLRQEDPAKQQQFIIAESHTWNQYAADVFEHTSNSSKCMYVKYEGLVTSPADYIETMLDFLGLQPTLYPDRYLEVVTPHSVDTWREELERNIIEQVTDITRTYLEKFQYLLPGE